MSRVRTRLPIEHVDRLAEEEDVRLEPVGMHAREFRAPGFGRSYRIERTPSGQGGLFDVTVTEDETGNRVESAATLSRVRALLRAARQRGEARGRG